MPDPNRYQGFVLPTEPQRAASLRAMTCTAWAYREGDDEPLFGVRLVLTDQYIRQQQGRQSASESEACEAALRWAHGLIDTETWESTANAIDVVRDLDWMPGRNDNAVDDESLRRDLLGVFARMARVSSRTDYAPQFDVEGFAEVIGVSGNRIRELLSEMGVRGWIEPWGHTQKVVVGDARITRDGFARLDALTETSPRGGGLGGLSKAIESYLADGDFRKRFPLAYAHWLHGCDLLSEEPLKSGIIGYACREAMQAFGGELIALHRIENAPPPAQVTKRMRLVVDTARVGERTTGLLDSLVAFSSNAFDFDQRQAKNALREGEELGPDDARRAVLYTALVMLELSRLPVRSR